MVGFFKFANALVLSCNEGKIMFYFPPDFFSFIFSVMTP